MNDKNLAKLIKESANGNEEAFEQLLEIILPILHRDISRYLNNKQDIDDVIQESIWKIWSSIDKVDVTADPIAFFRKITFNVLMSFYRKKRKREIYIPPEHFINIPDKEEDDENIDINYKIDHIISSLPPRYKQAITLRYIEQKSYEEIAKIMNISYPAARKIVSRAIKKLKKLVGDKNERKS